MTAPTPAGPAPSRTKVAKAVTDILQPRNMLLAGLTGFGVITQASLTGAAWGLFASLCAGVVPAEYIEWERRRGTWGDRHVVDRRQRPRIFAVILASIGIGITVMEMAGGPGDVERAMIALWGMTVVLLTVNTFWKISVDAAVASSVMALLAVFHSPWWLLGYVLVTAVCWTRVALTYHSVAQTVAGASLGAAAAGAWLLG
jgi:membrane-associated phospholipid phosphatase